CVRCADLIGQLPDAGFNVRLQMLGPLMSRNCAQHLSQAVEPLARFACHAESLLGPLVLRREIGRHPHNLSSLSNSRTCGHSRTESTRNPAIAPLRLMVKGSGPWPASFGYSRKSTAPHVVVALFARAFRRAAK